ncbi:hypothetical protein ACWCOT_02815 [Nonomuraea bangladeshensis]
MTMMMPYKPAHPCALAWCEVDHAINPEEPHSGDSEQFAALLDVALQGTTFQPDSFWVGVEQLGIGGDVKISLIGLSGGSLLLSLPEARRMAGWILRMCDDVEGTP